MEKGKKISEKVKIGEPGCLNKNCWLVKNLNYAPYKRCQYCELKFHNCLFLHYQIISLILIIFILTLSFLIEGENSKLVIISVFTLVIVYGYFFNKSTDNLIQAYFVQRKTNESLKELTETLEEKVDEQTKEIKKAYEELKVLDKAKSEFIAIASHQLRTPLTAMKGYLSMILEGSYNGVISGKIKEKVENIYQSNERLINLVNDLLNVSRIEAGAIKLKLEKTSLEETIKEVIEEIKIEAEKKNLYLRYQEPEKPLPSILLDKEKIKEVILNLIDNAIKYTQKGGITITAEVQTPKPKKREEILIKIKDTGVGLTKEEIEKLFESFSRSKAGTTFHIEGAGLGLYVARKFVEMHQGKAWVESQGKGKGSAFYIELPIK